MPNFSKLEDFEKIIQESDNKIHCFDKVAVVALGSIDSLLATEQAYSS